MSGRLSMLLTPATILALAIAFFPHLPGEAAERSEEIIPATRPRVKLRPNLERLAGQAYASGTRAETGAGAPGGRTKRRLLHSFEEGQDGQPVRDMRSEKLNIITVLDFGVTEGKMCARLRTGAGTQWGTFYLSRNTIRNWAEYDYLAMDVYTDDPDPKEILFELWDARARNYYTRATQGQTPRKGGQTLFFPINRAKRNGKEGRLWEELEPEDKINMNGLTTVKFFFDGHPKRPMTYWIDNIRLLQEDAAKPKLKIPLPRCTVRAFDFGSAGAVVPGFAAGSKDTRYSDQKGYGFTGNASIEDGGEGWPDLLSGTFASIGDGPARVLKFQATVPNGEYLVWLCAGKTLFTELGGRKFLLKVNDRVVFDDKPSPEEYDGEKYLYRFMWTQYSERPHALWLDYISRMYPVHKLKVSVTDGRLKLAARDCFVSGMIVLPGKEAAEFERMAAKLEKLRIAAFEKATHIPEQEKPKKKAGDGDYVVYVPDDSRGVGPGTAPTDAERGRTQIVAAGAPGQNVMMRLAVVPLQDLGPCELQLAGLKGRAGAISASNIKGHFVNRRYAGRWIREMVLLQALSLYVEKGVTQCFWLWLTVPDNASPGKYTGTFTFRTTNSKSTRIPVAIEVYPFKLELNLPVAYGMYYSRRDSPRPPAGLADKVFFEQMRWMSKAGFTSLTIPGGAGMKGVDIRGRKVHMKFDPAPFKAAIKAGLGQTPEQPLLVSQLSIARAIGRRLPGCWGGDKGSKVDQLPGIELKQPEFKALWFSAMRQYKRFLDDLGAPYAMEIVDEPREHPNPWNRNLADTLTYGKWMGEVGLRRFVTPMSDQSGDKDYTPLADCTDIVSIHGHKGGPRFMRKGKEKGKTLWFYNIGMNRFNWGFYPWAHGAKGRFEWHWRWIEGWVKSKGGYPGRDWYNPFTPMAGLAPNAPISAENPGGFLYASAYLSAADGITDYAYLYTLERRIGKHKAAGTKPAAVNRAEELLAGIRAEVLAGKRKTEAWRRQIAEQLKGLK